MLFTSSTDVYLSLKDEVIPNHGYVEISDIGILDDTALLCHTDGSSSGGDWFAPDGDRVGTLGTTDVQGFERKRGPMLVRNSDTPDEGIYHCDVNDATNTPQTIHVGLYNSGRGTYIHKSLSINEWQLYIK